MSLAAEMLGQGQTEIVAIQVCVHEVCETMGLVGSLVAETPQV